LASFFHGRKGRYVFHLGFTITICGDGGGASSCATASCDSSYTSNIIKYIPLLWALYVFGVDRWESEPDALLSLPP
jgi:hypothetical protein